MHGKKKTEQAVVLHGHTGGGSQRDRVADGWFKPTGEAGGKSARSSSGAAAPNALPA